MVLTAVHDICCAGFNKFKTSWHVRFGSSNFFARCDFLERFEHACRIKINIQQTLGRSGGQVVSVLTFYSDNPSSNPTEAFSFFSKKKNKNEQKEAGVGPLKTFNSGCGTVAERSLPTLDDSGSNPRLTVKK